MKWRRSKANIKLVVGRLGLVVEQGCERDQPGILVARTTGIGDAPIDHLRRQTQEEWEVQCRRN